MQVGQVCAKAALVCLTVCLVKPGPFQEFYQRSLAKGIKPTMVRLTLARKIAAITLTLWKKGEDFDINKLNSQAA